jgi:predicted HicB family RNase H-like nuclease
MIQNDDQLKAVQQAVFNLEKVLLEARKVHSAEEYRSMSEPILLEIQQREHEILAYLSATTAEVSAG